MAMTESESEAHLEKITVETPNKLETLPLEKDHSTDHQCKDDILPTDTFPIAPEDVSVNDTEAGTSTVKNDSSQLVASQTTKMDLQLLPSTSHPEREDMDVELQNEGQDEAFRGFESIDDIEIDAEQMLQIVNVISLCEQEGIINANESQLDDIINADQSQLEDIITDQCQLDEITISEEQFQLDESMTENNSMEVQEDLQCSNLLNDISPFDQQRSNGTENQFSDISSNLDQKLNENNSTPDLQLFYQQGQSVTEDQRLMVAEANLRYGIPTVEYEVDHEESPVVEQPYLCTECRQRFSEHDDLEQHLWDHIAAMTGKHPYRCSKCPGRTFSDMKEHKRHHRMGLECDVCGEAFHAAIILADHRMQAHTRSKVYTCKICKMSFTSRAELSQHKERHSKIKFFTCKICSESFQSEVGLSVHMKTHSGSSKIRNFIREKESPSNSSASKAYSCSQCGQDFISIQILDSHLKSEHSKVSESSLSCDVCQKSFLKLEDLKMHKASHSDLKLYKCEHCEASFSQKHAFKEHSQKHREERKCKVCGYLSSSSSRLVKHMRRNHRDKILECKYCSKWFTAKDDLSTHVDKEHKNALKRDKSYSYDQSKLEVKDEKHVPAKEVVDEDSRCESSCTTELSMDDNEGSVSSGHHTSEDKLLGSPIRELSPISESREKLIGLNEAHSLEPLKKKLKEDATPSQVESSKEISKENQASLQHSHKVYDDVQSKSSESSKVKLGEDFKSKSSDYSKDRSKGDKRSDKESSKSKSRHSSKDGSKDDEKSSGTKVQLKGFKIPKLRKSKEINMSESSDQSTEMSEEKGPVQDDNIKEKSRDDKKSRWGEPVPEERGTFAQDSTKLVAEEKRAPIKESPKPSSNKMPLLATPPISKLPLLPTPVSNKIPLLATPRHIKKSRWGEPVKEDTATVWSGPSRMQSVDTTQFVTNESSVDRTVGDQKERNDIARDKSKQIRKSRWGEPLKDGEPILSSSITENSMEDKRLKANQPVKPVEDRKSFTESPSPGQLIENNKVRLNQSSPLLPLPDGNVTKSSTVSYGQTIPSNRLKTSQVPTGKPTEDSRSKPTPMPVGRPAEEARFKSNPSFTAKRTENNNFKSNPLPAGKPREDSRFNSDGAHSGKLTEDPSKSNPVSTGRPTEEFRFDPSVPPPGRPLEESRSKIHPLPVGRPVENSTLKSNGILLGMSAEDDGFKLNPMPVERPLANKIKLNLLPAVRPDDSQLKTNWSLAKNHTEKNRFSSARPTSEEQLELEYKKFEMLLQSSTEKTVTNTELEYKKFEMLLQSSSEKANTNTELEYKKFEMLIQSSSGKAVTDTKSILYNPAKEKGSLSGTDSSMTSYKSLIGPMSDKNKSVVHAQSPDENRSIYSGSPMDMSIADDDSSSDKSVEIIKEDQDEGLTWGASFLEENKLIWGKSFLEDQTSMLHEPLKEKGKEKEKPSLTNPSKVVTKLDKESGKSLRESKPLCSKSLKSKVEDQTKSSSKMPVDIAQSVDHNASQESSADITPPVWLDSSNVKPLEDPSMYYNPSNDEAWDSSSPERDANSPTWATSSMDMAGTVYPPLPPAPWGESSTSQPSAAILYGEQHIHAQINSANSKFLQAKLMEHYSSNSHYSHSAEEENKGSNLSELLEEWVKGNKPDDPVQPHKLERPKGFVPPGVMSNAMKWGESLNHQHREETSGEDKKSNLSDLLEEWLKEHKNG
ncbi:Zinc finger protein 26 [Frankliniella fusca]|uniref:Zinc finger protein 26 n=1 Tax=Frankliniella fusca TaxID=407009 RepID=A0AAE1GX91_9NEOP|nr:Zinc finger protein 26 [Frankliniella fusca]